MVIIKLGYINQDIVRTFLPSDIKIATVFFLILVLRIAEDKNAIMILHLKFKKPPGRGPSQLPSESSEKLPVRTGFTTLSPTTWSI